MARASAARWPERRSLAMVLMSRGAFFGKSMPCFTTADQARRGGALLRRLAVPQSCIQLVDEFFGGVGNDGGRREDRFGAGFIEFVVILRRHDAADDDHDVLTALLLQCSLEFWHGGEMGCRQRRHAQNMHVVLDRLTRGFLGGCK